MGSWVTPLLTLLHREKWTLGPFDCYHLISSKSIEGLFLQSCRNFIFLTTFGVEPWQRPFENPYALWPLDLYCVARFLGSGSIGLSWCLRFSSFPPCCIRQVLTSMLFGPASLRWTCQWTLETGSIGNESWEREADFAVIPWKGTSQDRGPCLSCVNCIFSDQNTPSGDIPTYWLSRCQNNKKKEQRSTILEAETSRKWTRLNWKSKTKGGCQLAWDSHFTFMQVGTQSRHFTVGYRRRRQIQQCYIRI